jgi:8-hydroxy-5-deazaflavin:NADPH oxidoreductase
MHRTLVLLALARTILLGGPVVAQEKPTVAVIGTGTLSSVLGPAIAQRGYRVIYGSRDPDREAVRSLVARSGPAASAATPAAAAARAEIVILAVPNEVLEEVAGSLGPLSGKVIVDVSGGRKRIAADGYLELIPDSAFAERIQARHSDSRVVRINLPNMMLFLNPLLLGTRPTVLIAGNDPSARAVVAQLVFDTGMDPWDAGPLRFARIFDAINVMNLIPAQQGRMEGYELKLLPSIPFSCFFDMSEHFGFGRPYDRAELPSFPRRDPVISCEEWMRRLGPGDQGQA